MSKNSHLSSLDPNQITTKEHDESLDAKRVVLVGGEKLNITLDETKLVEAVKQGLNSLTLPQNQTSGEIQVINVPTKENVFIPHIEIKEIEKQVIVPQIEYRTIEIPVVTERIVTVEKPIVIKEIEFKEIVKERYYPKVITICALIQAGCMIGLLLLNILRKI